MKTYSLTRRILVLVVGVSLASLLTHAYLLFNWMQPLGEELASRMSSQVQAVASALKATQPARRDQVADAFNAAGLSVSRNAPPLAKGRRPAVPPLLDAVRRTLGAEVQVVASGAPEKGLRLHFGLPVDEQTWWVSFQAPKPSLVRTLTPMLGTIALIALAGGITLWVGVRMITRPMSRLADDMLARRQALRPIEEPPHGSRELREVIRSFNELVHALELAGESRRNLLAGVSHDLRTPLARLRLRAELECPEAAYALMERDFEALSHIVDQFLAYSQGEAGAALGGAQPLGALVRQVTAQYADSGHDVRVVHEEAIDMPVPDVSVQRVLSNLVDNALAHGRGTVALELRRVPGGAQVMVFDQGRGIPVQALEHALAPFVRMGDKQASDGHCGLGLAIVAQVAAQLQGRVLHHPFDGRRSGIGFFVPSRSA